MKSNCERSRRQTFLVPRAIVVLFIVTTVLVASSATAGPQVAPFGDENGEQRPGTWRGTGGALGVRAYFNMDPRPLPVDDFLTLHVPDATTEWTSTGDARARASSVFPGQTVVGLPDLLATFGVPGADQLLPPFPATAFAGPTNPDVTSADGSSRARVGEGSEFIEAVGRAAVPGATDALAPFVNIEGAEARTRQEFEEGGVLVSRSESRVGAVKILGGLVSFDGVRAVAEARASESGEPEATTETHVSNASIAGTSVRIGDEGIEVGGMVIPPGGLPDTLRPSGVAGRVNEIVKAFGLDIRPLGSDTRTEAGTGRARAGGVIVDVAIPVDGPGLPTIPLNSLPVNPNDLLAGALPLPLPDIDGNTIYRTYLLSVVIGEANAQVFAGEGGAGLDGGGLGNLGPLDDAPLTDSGADFGSDVGSDFASPPSSSTAGSQPPVDSSLGAPDSSSGGDQPVAIGSTGDPDGLLLLGANVADRVGVLFAVLALLSMAALAGMRLITLPARDGA